MNCTRVIKREVLGVPMGGCIKKHLSSSAITWLAIIILVGHGIYPSGGAGRITRSGSKMDSTMTQIFSFIVGLR